MVVRNYYNMRRITLYRKIYLCTTNSCQLQCKGCYMSSICQKTQQVDLNLVRKVLDSYKDDEIECVFHGGEPFFDRSYNTIQSYIDLVKSYPNVKWSATTNLVYEITPQLMELFSLFNNRFIKTSWDIGDYRFKTPEQQHIWEKNVNILLYYGFDVEVIITVNNQLTQAMPQNILNYMYEMGIRCINFERITENGRAKEVKVKPTNREIDDWLYEAYTYNNEHTHLIIPIFDELVAISKGAEPLGCRRRECMKVVTTINSNNTIATCPNISNIVIGDKDNYYKDKHQELIDMENKRDNRCLICKYYNICRGECCQLKYDETGCPGLTRILESLCI